MQKLLAVIAVISFCSCVDHKLLVNFNQGPEFPKGPQPIQLVSDIRIQADDLLEIGVYAEEPAAVAPFTLQGIGAKTNEQNNVAGNNFLVDQLGNIEFPILGKLKLAGLTIEQARDSLTNKVGQYIANPIVTVRWLNFKFTVLGEVSHPATYTLPERSVTVLEAIGLAGDLTNYGNRKNILIIREQDGNREFGRINLQDRAVFQSPFFYLKQNDVVYVEPLKQKTGIVSDQASKVLPWISAGAIVANIFILIFR
ncbi:MAG: polysaccharide biosynthesis/export family protein [Saprospiraceae bacterium]|nr:polysaccharide biosynthesis/export family protein [Saprospiraceae bacterium]MCB9342234.1 polysaccharide biosynthesis/export family protein [Lewinellaceae bacterium]